VAGHFRAAAFARDVTLEGERESFSNRGAIRKILSGIDARALSCRRRHFHQRPDRRSPGAKSSAGQGRGVPEKAVN